MERGIEAGHVRHPGEPLPQSLQHIERRRVVQRRQRRNRLDLRQCRIIDQDRAVQIGAAMHDAMAESGYLARKRAVGQRGQRLHRRMWVGG